MAKLIGTGKDPRFPEGVDYDVNEQDVQHHVDAGLGEPVEPGTEAYAVHRGYDTIAADPGEDTGHPAEQADHDGASRVAARVETTAFKGKPVEGDKALDKAADTATEDDPTEGALSVEGGSAGEKPRGARAAAKSGAAKSGAEAKTGK